MKKYVTPETKNLTMTVQMFVCGQGYAPQRRSTLDKF